MTRSIKFATLAALLAVTLCAGSPAVRADTPAAAAAVTCGPKGNYSFTGVNSDWTQVVPSVRKQISALGLMAMQTGCDVSAICVATDVTKDAMASARKSCANLTRAFTQTVVKTERPAKRSQVVAKAKKPGSGLTPGAVYISVR